MKYLTYTERIKIESLFRAHIPVSEIAIMLGRARSTIYKELKRDSVYLVDSLYRPYLSYSADIAQQKHDYAQTSKGVPLKLGSDHAFAAFIVDKIKNEKYSPAAALAAARFSGYYTSICVNTLYNYIHAGILPLKPSDLLRCHRKKKVRPLTPSKVLDAPCISNRPAVINDRSVFGHWEMDCVCGKSKTRPALLVLTERKFRYEIIFKIQDKTMSSVVSVLDFLENTFGDRFGQIFQTLTVDNGSEFRDYHGMCRSLSGGKRLEVFYCHPYRSGERGSNENANSIIRRFFPKGTDFNNVTFAEVQFCQDWMNHYPRKILNWNCAADLVPIHLNDCNPSFIADR